MKPADQDVLFISLYHLAQARNLLQSLIGSDFLPPETALNIPVAIRTLDSVGVLTTVALSNRGVLIEPDSAEKHLHNSFSSVKADVAETINAVICGSQIPKMEAPPSDPDPHNLN